MALRRRERPSTASKLDATPPWDPRPVHDVEPTTGPYDIADAPEDGRDRLDLGALRVPIDGGVEVRVEIGEDGSVAAVTLLNETGQMQLGLFAAPRSEGIWDDVRAEIKASMSSQGGTVQESKGDFGTELSGRLPVPGGFNPMRFIGVDGPKWFLRAMLAGAPALEPAAAGPFLEIFRNVIVVRGNTPLPVRDPVPLTLPRDAAEQLAALQAQQQAGEIDQA